jgi:serine/threonine protein kinase
MGEVYKARDTRLDRSVAVKVLSQHLSSSPEVRQRFEREAKAIAALSHPHICALYDVNREGETEYLVMELLEGETLSERLVKGPLPLEQTLRCGIEIADALDKAHRQGIVHRDLKPGNGMLTKSGVKLLDFGLAKLAAPPSGPMSGLSMLPTTPKGSNLTDEGTILGTLQYMAPEQLEGKEADARTDIFAFGALLYEMATGKKAFLGTSQASLIGSILKDEPAPISTVQPMTPPGLDRVIRTCLAKDPEDRWQSAHDVGSELKWIASTSSEAGLPAPVALRRRTRERLAWIGFVLVSSIAVALVVMYARAVRRADRSESRVLHLQVQPPPGERMFNTYRGFAISPDGTKLALVLRRSVTSSLALKSLSDGSVTPIPATEDADHPFFSPDGKWIGFVAANKLKKVAVSGGAPIVLTDAPWLRGAAWSDDGFIYVTPNVNTEVRRVPADGGEATTVTKLHSSEGEKSHRWVEVVPAAKVILYTLGLGQDWNHAKIVAENLDTGLRRVVVNGGTSPRYLPDGVLVYEREGSIFAIAFDPKSLSVSGTSVEVAKNVDADAFGLAQMDFSRTGVLVTASPDTTSSDFVFAWIDRAGKAEPFSL